MKNHLTKSRTLRTAPQSSAIIRRDEQQARWNAIKDDVIERYTAAAVELASLRATDPFNPRVDEIEADYPWIDEDFPASMFEPEYDELDYDCALSNRLEGAIN